jgi:hypothetical protein
MGLSMSTSPPAAPRKTLPRWTAAAAAVGSALAGVLIVRSLMNSGDGFSWKEAQTPVLIGVTAGIGLAATLTLLLVFDRTKLVARFRGPSALLIGGLTGLMATTPPRLQMGGVSFAFSFVAGISTLMWLKWGKSLSRK